mmetsp:Transcript_68795/g.138305  ORF Transcript_68795/g.138305 Transcript_68795/m.138305 type:complete len:91 (+) Transcript_68795:221-493(+)|eukprot:CAMPEP_0171734744 /NCGR_PEP_ID=MMETSP0991-20121206/31144_1 /TAXON_ID=483369 /ORGANISM="non described non described, Strain CCMP2098" /LENGTH=90 /DNA_ID=CAMNT_0012330877 /DNA_START=302 /DNA_END=574 /DNA_ORIENTATION=-
MEFVGEIFAELLGLNQSSYQWVIDSVEHDERVRKRSEELARYRRRMVADLREHKEAEIAEAAETGEGGQSGSEEEGGEEVEEDAELLPRN